MNSTNYAMLALSCAVAIKVIGFRNLVLWVMAGLVALALVGLLTLMPA